jgi:hypothetical protein
MEISDYQLVHLGATINSGHYFTVQFQSPESSIKFNDEKAERTDQKYYEDVYLLIYARKK